MKMQKHYHQLLAITADGVIFGFDKTELKLLLLKREKEPFKHKWALPGGYVFSDETTEESAKRILFEKVGLKNVFIEQLYTFSDIDRDPRERTISVSYYALVNRQNFELIAGRDFLHSFLLERRQFL
jgi:8-oxo-dGTP diphosphatase